MTENKKDWGEAFTELTEKERLHVAAVVLKTMLSGEIPSFTDKKVFGVFSRLCPNRLKDLWPYFWVALPIVSKMDLNKGPRRDMLNKLIESIKD